MIVTPRDLRLPTLYRSPSDWPLPVSPWQRRGSVGAFLHFPKGTAMSTIIARALQRYAVPAVISLTMLVVGLGALFS